jgi:S1-C subfamily serine protease
MATSEDWEVPQPLRPRPESLQFDLQTVYRSVVLLHTETSEDAYTASILGTDRIGHGVVIRSAERKLVLTIGYLTTEAESIWLTDYDGRVVEAYPLALDSVSGFGLVQPLGALDAPAIERGSASALAVGDRVIVAGHGGARHSLEARLIARREFAGYWEYLLDEAIFTAPATVNWQGAALINKEGKLIGVGSLVVGDALGARAQVPGNMFVPIDLLKPILGDLIAQGKSTAKPRPWLGISTQDLQGKMMVTRVSPESPAEEAGLVNGDIIVGVRGEQVQGHADFYRKLWASGDAGAEVMLDVLKGTEVKKLGVKSIDRNQYLRRQPTY